jgi:hypothetical protein
MQTLLKEVLENAAEVAVQSNDEPLIKEYSRLIRNVEQSHHRNFKEPELIALYYISDGGSRVCDMLKEQATTAIQFEKTDEVKTTYTLIKKEIIAVLNMNGYDTLGLV